MVVVVIIHWVMCVGAGVCVVEAIGTRLQVMLKGFMFFIFIPMAICVFPRYSATICIDSAHSLHRRRHPAGWSRKRCSCRW